MKHLFIPLVACCIAAFPVAAMAEDASCTNGTPPLPAGYEGWRVPHPLTAATRPEDLPQSMITLNHAFMVHLAHTSDVHFLQRPSEPGGSVSYSGMVDFVAPHAGTYRVMLPNKTWIDVLSGSTRDSSTRHQHGPDCSGIRKMVDFSLQAGPHTLQLTGSGLQDMPVMVLAIP